MNDIQKGDNAGDDADAGFDDVDAAAEAESRPPRRRFTARGMAAWLALLLAVIAIAVLGLDYLRDRNSAADTAALDARVASLTSTLDATREALGKLEQALTESRDRVSTINETVDRIDRDFNDRLRRVESMPARVASLEASMAALQGISAGARDAWLVAEAEYYMQIANAQLQLAGNPELARIALTNADERILQLGDPRLTPVRQALSDELRALELIQKPDIAGITLTLASLAGVVDSLPLKQEVTGRDETAKTAIDPELSGMDRAIQSVKNAVSGIVSVRKTDEALAPLIAPEAQYFLRANLSLQLQTARLALLRGEETVFHQSLDDADAWLAEYYDPDSTAVASARETIRETRNSIVDVTMPDISQSLRLLRQFEASADAAPESEPAGQDQ